jgi:hypothetical protein
MLSIYFVDKDVLVVAERVWGFILTTNTTHTTLSTYYTHFVIQNPSFRAPETLISLHKTLFVTHYIISLYKTYTTLYTTLITLRASLLTRYYIALFNINNTHYVYTIPAQVEYHLIVDVPNTSSHLI